jgi:hypothetical protein
MKREGVKSVRPMVAIQSHVFAFVFAFKTRAGCLFSYLFCGFSCHWYRKAFKGRVAPDLHIIISRLHTIVTIIFRVSS